MDNSDILILKAGEVADLLSGREAAVIAAVQMAYEAHRREQSSLPPSTFLRFPDSQRNRIIALPAYLGGESGGAGIKWVSSFPENVGQGMNRASAVVILNSPLTGLPYLIAEGSIIQGARILNSVVGIRSQVAADVSLERVMMMGADFYEDAEDFDYNRQVGIPNIGIGKASVIRKAIIDKNAHIGENVQILNVERIQNFDGPGYYIRDGIVMVPKNGVVQNGTII